jgi:hypothetical protein
MWGTNTANWLMSDIQATAHRQKDYFNALEQVSPFDVKRLTFTHRWVTTALAVSDFRVTYVSSQCSAPTSTTAVNDT